MARMIPDPIRTDIKSPAERRLYEQFRLQLSDDWTVFHQVPWQFRDLLHGARDGETDYVLAHPDKGILVLEVKGGIIRYEGSTAQWYSNDNPIKDPFNQARDSMYSLRRLLQEHSYWRTRRVIYGYAVAFPDVDVTQKALRPDAPRAIIMDKSHIRDLPTWVNGVLLYWQGQSNHNGPGATGIKELEQLLGPSIYLSPLLSSEIEEEAQELLNVTEEQFILLDFLGRQRRAAISGYAGSGKTLMAIEKAKRLSQQGFQALLTCYNRNLAESLKNTLTDYPDIHVAHFHGLCADLARKAGLISSRNWGGNSAAYFDVTLPSLLVDAVDKLDWHVDAIIVDEGQDFNEDWWLPLQYVLRDLENGILYIFHDDNQNLYQPNSRLPLESAPYSLTKNCRNTQSIHDFTKNFYQASHPIIAAGPTGRPVRVLRYSGENDLKRHLRTELHYLILNQGVSADDIVVLTPRAYENSSLWKFGQLGNIRLVPQRTGASGEVFCTTIHQYKGLESPVIILAEIEPDTAPDLKKLLYIGTSRACNHLIVIVHNALSREYT